MTKYTVTMQRIPYAPLLYRVKHDAELGPLWRQAPEVFLLNDNRTPFGADWQRLSFALNPGMTSNHWRALYGDDEAFTNGNGFNGPNARADFVNNCDLSAPLPAWDKTRVCGGATVTGIVDGMELVVDILDGTGPAPTLEWLLARPWLYFHALTVYGDGHVGEFPQNNPCLVPLVGSGEARIPLAQVQKVPRIADPYKIG